MPLTKTRKRRFLVGKRTTRPVRLVTEAGGRRKFWSEIGGKSDFFYVSDPAEAEEIDCKYGSKGTRDVWVKEHDSMSSVARDDGAHRYFFGFSRAFGEGWERVFGKKVQNG